MKTETGRLRANWVWLALACLMLCTSNCREPLEGCLDRRAVNYTAAADQNCCCEWPELRFSVEHLMQETVHVPDSSYVTLSGQAYRLFRVDMVLSDFKLHFRDLQPVTLLDSIRLRDGSADADWIKDDIVVLDRDVAFISPGRFIAQGELDSISFLLGLPESLRGGKPEDLPSGHPFRVQASERYSEGEGFAVARAWLIRQPSGDTLQWVLREARRVAIPVGQSLAPGRTVSLTLRVDYDAWFRQQDLSPQGSPDNIWGWQIASGFR